MRLLGPIACRKVCRITAEITENDQSVVLNCRLPVSTFSPTIGLDAATSSSLTGLRSIVLPLELNVRVRSRRRSSLPSQTLVLPLQLPSPSEGETSSRRACGSRKADRGTQETREMERLLASSNVRMPAQKLRSRILSFENVKGNDD